MGAVGSKKREYKIGGSGKSGESSKNQNEEFVETVVCRDEEFEDGKMSEISLNNDIGKILLVKENGVYSALGTHCTHYGAPLKNGVLMGGKIRCPWHGACFNSQTGDIEDFPGLDSLPCYQVTVENGDVKVKVSVADLENKKRIKPMVKCSHANPSTFVIIGGGGAGLMCSETLRQEGYTGKIIFITQEKHVPYDRPKLSKALDRPASELYLRKPDFFKRSDITLMVETKVTSIDTEGKWVSCNDGKLKVKYEKLMIATGGQPLKMKIPGSVLENIFYLRRPEDGNMIAKAAVGKSIVVIGSSFIGMEVAAFMIGKAATITVIGRSPVPFANVFGQEIGQRIRQLFESKEIDFHFEKEVVRFVGEDTHLTGVELATGEVIPADVCVIGIGVRPSTDFLEGSGISVSDRGLVLVNEMLETNVKGIYAGGDIVEFPLNTYGGSRVNIAHWQMALAHGRAAALNMLEKNTVFESVPFFWSTMCGKNFRYAGYAKDFDEVLIKGDLEKLKFSAYYIRDSNVVAICTCDSDPEAAHFASLVSKGEKIAKSDVDSTDFKQLCHI